MTDFQRADGKTPTYKMPPLSCPFCGSVLDAVTSFYTGLPPGDGDASVCFECAQPSMFATSPLGIRYLKVLSPLQLTAFLAQHEDSIEVLREFNREHPR